MIGQDIPPCSVYTVDVIFNERQQATHKQVFESLVSRLYSFVERANSFSALPGSGPRPGRGGPGSSGDNVVQGRYDYVSVVAIRSHTTQKLLFIECKRPSKDQPTDRKWDRATTKLADDMVAKPLRQKCRSGLFSVSARATGHGLEEGSGEKTP